MDPTDGAALRCGSCGASLPIPEVASAVCDACGEVTRIDGALLQQLHAHRREVGTLRAEVEHATEHSVLAQMTRQYGGRWAMALVASWIVAGFVSIPESAINQILALALFVGPFFGMAWHGKRIERRLRAEVVAARQAERTVFVACPTCGGQNEFLPDDPIEPCRFCRGALVADSAARASMLAVAQDSATQERWQATHERWKTHAYTNRDPRTDLVPWFVVGGLGSIIVVGTVLTSIRMALGGPAPDGLIALWITTAIIVLGLGIPLSIRRRRARTWDSALQALAERTGGRLRRRPVDLVDWCIAHWRGPLLPDDIGGWREYAVLVSTEVPLWALSVAPLALKDGKVEAHLRLFVPGDPQGALLRRLIETVEAHGMQSRSNEGGLVAELPLPRVHALYDAPDRLEALAEVIASASGPIAASPLFPGSLVRGTVD